MTYELKTTDGKHSRLISQDEFKSILRMAITNGWKPSSAHIRDKKLQLDAPFSPADSQAFASALERGLQKAMASSPPNFVVMVLESIAVLRRGETQFVRLEERNTLNARKSAP